MYQELIPLVTDVRVSYANLYRVLTAFLVIVWMANQFYNRADKKMADAQKSKSTELAKQALRNRLIGTVLLVAFSGVIVLIDMATNPTVARITDPLVAAFGSGGKSFPIAGNQISVGLIAIVTIVAYISILVAGYKKLSVTQFLILGLALYIFSLVMPPLREAYRLLMSAYIWCIELVDSILGTPGAIALMALSVATVIVIDLLGGLASKFVTPITSRAAILATISAFAGAFYIISQVPLPRVFVDILARAARSVGQISIELAQSEFYVWFVVAIIVVIWLVSVLVKVSDMSVSSLMVLSFLIYSASPVWSQAKDYLVWVQSFIYGTMGILNTALSGVPT